MLRGSAQEKSHIECPVPKKKLKSLKPQVFLEGKELWNCFYRLGTEMIITKTGRSVSSHFAFLLIARWWDNKIYSPQSPELRWINRFRSLVVFITVRVGFFLLFWAIFCLVLIFVLAVMSSALLASLVRFGVQLISLITQSDLNCPAAKWPKIVVYPFAACF